MNKKLIEVAIPLEAINKESAREKSIRHGHPSTLHLWWARRPLATARAVLFASLVDDPSSHPELFPTKGDENKERERLFQIIEELIKWENSNNPEILEKARNEIARYVSGPIGFLDPFAGGGAIPLEAKRLGLKSYAYDLNPVAVTINKSMIEIPSYFLNYRPVNPEARQNTLYTTYKEYEGLAEDVRYYGQLLKKITWNKVKQYYPECKTKDGNRTVIAWIWSRSIVCPNPMCSCIVPMIKSTTLSVKQKTYVEFTSTKDDVIFNITKTKPSISSTIVSKRGGLCPVCNASIDLEYIHQQFKDQKVTPKLITTICEGNPGRLYNNPDLTQINAADAPRPQDIPKMKMEGSSQYMNARNYGLESFSDLYTDRQLLTLSTFSKSLKELQQVIIKDAKKAGLAEGLQISKGGNGATAYSETIITYLSFVIDKLADRNTSVCSWDTSRDGVRNTFGRQAIPMVWDYAECNPFSNSTGSFNNMLDWVVESIQKLPVGEPYEAKQHNAMESFEHNNLVISTDPPYYDNVDYSNLSDFFYMWLRPNLKDIFPEIYTTIRVPKEDELVALPYRHENDRDKAKSFFETGMMRAFKSIYLSARDDVPVTIYYAFKQREKEIEKQDSSEQYSSSGWETFLTGVIQSGFIITGTWPMRTEMVNRMRGIDSNALSSSIVLVCRKGSHSGTITQREFVSILKKELKEGLNGLQNSNIAPVDLAQSAIGPGISVYSRYDSIIQSDGSKMDVKNALQIINRELDAFLNENESSMDSESRFCLDLYSNYAYNELNYGDAEVLSKAKNASIEHMKSLGIVNSEKGKVSLVERKDLLEKDEKSDKRLSTVWHMCQHLTALLETGGIEECAKFLVPYAGTLPGDAKSLAYHLFTIAEKKKWTQEAIAYNSLVTSWPDIQVRKDELVEQLSPKEKVTLDRWSS